MAEQVVMWKAKDGKLFETEKQAEDHEQFEALVDRICSAIWWNGDREDAVDAAVFILENFNPKGK